MPLETMTRMVTTDTLAPLDATSADEQARPALGEWPMGAIVATNWVAHRSGSSPEGDDVFEAVALGLIENECMVAARGRAALREHGSL
jgi:hypothetical protein